MASIPVEAGIDLGTTNSSIAHFHNGEIVVCQNDEEDITTPSVVYIDADNSEFVGLSAKNRWLNDPKNGHREFKRQMGSDGKFAFEASGKVKSAPELSASVLSAMRRYYAKESGQELQTAVITIPARFDAPARQATSDAAIIAGIKYYPLLQEPVAAGLIYGFKTDEKSLCWMVYDLGGGTFDVSLLIVRDGFLDVLAHAGNNHLGGKNFDNLLFRYVMDELNKKYALESLKAGNDKYIGAYAKLISAVEDAKIGLSDKDPDYEARVAVPGVLCKDEKGRDVEVEVYIRRSDYDKLIAPRLEWTVKLSQKLIAENRLTPDRIDRLILVGGPTKSRFLQEMLQERLNIELDTSVDPMTAVALGAAIYAQMEAVPDEIAAQITKQRKEDVHIDLKCHNISALMKAPIGGIINSDSDIEYTSLSVEIIRSDGMYKSGKIPVNEDGVFQTSVELQKDNQNIFTVEVRNSNGRLLAQAEAQIFQSSLINARTKLPNSLKVVLRGNRTSTLIEEGVNLPARGFNTFQTTRSFRKGDSDDMLRIKVVEGESERADRNLSIGELSIPAVNIPRDIPEGSDIEVTLHAGKAGEVTAQAYIPVLDEEYEVKLDLHINLMISETEKLYKEQKERFDEVAVLQKKKPLDKVAKALEELDFKAQASNIEMSLGMARDGVDDALGESHRQVLTLANGLDEIEKLQCWVKTEEKIRKIQEEIDNVKSKALGDIVTGQITDANQELEALKNQFAAAKADNDASNLDEMSGALDAVDSRVSILTNPKFWQAIIICDLQALQKMPSDVIGRLDVMNHAMEAISAFKSENVARMQEAHSNLSSIPGLMAKVQETIGDRPLGSVSNDVDIDKLGTH